MGIKLKRKAKPLTHQEYLTQIDMLLNTCMRKLRKARNLTRQCAPKRLGAETKELSEREDASQYWQLTRQALVNASITGWQKDLEEEFLSLHAQIEGVQWYFQAAQDKDDE